MQESMMPRAGSLFATGWALLALSLVAPHSARGQEIAPPYSVDELLLMLQGPQTQDRIAELVSSGCIEFEMDAFVILDLRAEGAGDALIDALNNACVEDPATVAARDEPVDAPSTESVEDEPRIVTAPASSRRTLTGRGFYGAGRWLRLHYSSLDQTKSAGITWATMTSGAVEFALWGAGSQETIEVPAVEDLKVWDTDLGMSLNLFLVQPSSGFPLGFYLGGLGGLSRTWADGAFDDGVNRYRYGWDAGAFGRLGNDDISLVPRVVRRWTKNNTTSDSAVEPWVVETIILGAEANLGGFVPGVFLHLIDGNSRTVIAVTFAF